MNKTTLKLTQRCQPIVGDATIKLSDQLSNAALKSKRTKTEVFPASAATSRSFITFRSAVSVL